MEVLSGCVICRSIVFPSCRARQNFGGQDGREYRFTCGLMRRIVPISGRYGSPAIFASTASGVKLSKPCTINPVVLTP